MADHTTQSIVINAEPKDVMAVISDFDNYPKWVSAAREVKVEAVGYDGKPTRVLFDLDAGVLKDIYVLEYYWANDDSFVAWKLASSKLQREQRGKYTVLAQGDGSSKVSYELTVDLLVPIIGKLKRRAEKEIINSALRELKKRVEG